MNDKQICERLTWPNRNISAGSAKLRIWKILSTGSSIRIDIVANDRSTSSTSMVQEQESKMMVRAVLEIIQLGVTALDRV